MVTPDAYTLAKAHLLINYVEGELRFGTKHFNSAGRQLTTVKDIILTMRDEGGVTIEPARHRLQHLKEILRKYAAVSLKGRM